MSPVNEIEDSIINIKLKVTIKFGASKMCVAQKLQKYVVCRKGMYMWIAQSCYAIQHTSTMSLVNETQYYD